MPRPPVRTLAAVFAVVLAAAPAACGSGAPSASPSTRTISLRPQPAVSATPTATSAPATSAPETSAPETSAPAGTRPTNLRPASGSGLNGRTVVVNCPVDRADPPCPGTQVRARVVVLDRTGQATIATVDTGADGRFTVALPAGSYVIRAAPTGGGTGRRPTIRPVTVSAGRFTTVTLRLVNGLS
jgi:hypothetical protein